MNGENNEALSSTEDLDENRISEPLRQDDNADDGPEIPSIFADGSLPDDPTQIEEVVSQDIFSVLDMQAEDLKADDGEDAPGLSEDDPETSSDIDEDGPAYEYDPLFPLREEKACTEKPEKKREVGKRAIDTLFDFIELFIFTLVTVLVITTFVFRHSVVSGPSMLNTLNNGDKLIITNLFYEPEYKDIVVVHDYSCGMDIPIVKRVIATEGQKVRVAPEGIYVNGTFLNEEEYVFTDGKDYSYALISDPFKDNDTLVEVPGKYFEFVVPEGEIFILGDHRNDSKDSRFYGTIREDAILGKVILRLSPFTIFN